MMIGAGHGSKLQSLRAVKCASFAAARALIEGCESLTRHSASSVAKSSLVIVPDTLKWVVVAASNQAV